MAAEIIGDEMYFNVISRLGQIVDSASCRAARSCPDSRYSLEDELKQHSDNCQTASKVLTTLAPLVGEYRDDWIELARRLDARATRLREKACEVEQDAPDFEADTAPQAFDIAALFADL